MFNRLSAISDAIRSSLWVWPILMTTLGLAAAQAMILLDQSGWVERRLISAASERFGIDWLFGLGADGARSLLATIAGSMIAIAATVFSVTIVALSLAAGQMGPRLLRTFMRDRGTQLSLGTFIATFAFNIVLLGVVNGSGPRPFVPSASLTVAFVLALISLAVLIYFIHHVAKSIQAPQVIAVVGADLDEAIDKLYPRPASEAAEAGGAGTLAPLAFHESDGAVVRSSRSGYIQHIDLESLVKLCTGADLVVGLARRPGDHVIAGTVLATIWPRARLDDDCGRRVREAFGFGHVRTPVQDVQFLINQLVEIAQRALSPGINDPSTAAACIDHLAAALGTLAGRRLQPPWLVDDAGVTRVVASRPDTFQSLVSAAFDPIRSYSGGSLQVCLRLVDVMAELAQLSLDVAQRRALMEQVGMIGRLSDSLKEPRDRERLEAACQSALHRLVTTSTSEDGGRA